MRTFTRKRAHRGFIKYETYLRRKRIKRYLAIVWHYTELFLSALSIFVLLYLLYILMWLMV